MAAKYMLKGIVALAMATTAYSAAHAGGFSRGEADTDILFEDGVFVVRGGVTYVNPERKFKTAGGTASDDAAYTNDYYIPSFAMKLGVSDNFACALTYTQPFGGDSTYGADAQAADAAVAGSANYAKHKEFSTNEYAGTCDVKFSVGPGKLHFLGGVFAQDFSYTAESFYGTLRLDDDASMGYRLGIAYDIPEYAMRAELMYRSEVKHEADGSFTADALAGLLGSDPVSADGVGTLPQSLKLSLRSGVAPGWLVYGSVKWTDWSVLETLDYNIAGLGAQQDIYNWRDGWTIQAGVAHAFTDDVAGTVNLTWDRGVGTGADIMTDTWTLAAGTAIKCKVGEFRLGAAVSYLTEGSQATSKGASYDATADGDWAYALSASYRVSF